MLSLTFQGTSWSSFRRNQLQCLNSSKLYQQKFKNKKCQAYPNPQTQTYMNLETKTS